MHPRLIPLFSCVFALILSGCADTQHRLVVSVAEQRMAYFDQDKFVAMFPVSTSKFGLGDVPDSNATPLGRMKIAEKIGEGQPLGMKFKDRRPAGEIVAPNAPGRDPIVTRILWLKGTEAQNSQCYGRCIYIHGTPEEAKLGTPASYGCVRMSSKHIAWLYEQVGLGARVDIVAGPLPAPDALPR